MKVFYSAIVALACLFGIGGCGGVSEKPAEPDSPAVEVEGIVIRNELAFPVTDVYILAMASGNFAGCGNILPRSECSTTFETVDYRRGSFEISWKEYGAPQSTGEFVIEIPERLNPEKTAWLEVVIFSMGQAGARLVQ